MTDKTVSVSLATKPEVDYSFDLHLPEEFAPAPGWTVKLPYDNEARIYQYTWHKLTDGTRLEITGWRIEYSGPYTDDADKDSDAQTEITLAHHVGAYLKKRVKDILAAQRRKDQPNEGCAKEIPDVIPSRHKRHGL